MGPKGNGWILNSVLLKVDLIDWTSTFSYELNKAISELLLPRNHTRCISRQARDNWMSGYNLVRYFSVAVSRV